MKYIGCAGCALQYEKNEPEACKTCQPPNNTVEDRRVANFDTFVFSGKCGFSEKSFIKKAVRASALYDTIIKGVEEKEKWEAE